MAAALRDERVRDVLRALIFMQLKIEAAELGADALNDIAEYLAYDQAPEAIGIAGWAAEQRTAFSSRQASDPSAP